MVFSLTMASIIILPVQSCGLYQDGCKGNNPNVSPTRCIQKHQKTDEI